ncbi:hypothetical protein OIO90_003141 [Microbotryomycetes sp. JL221]|nr:hypothetical protein OIO90_003141 [Microbotryomycetes sp. JL221]
MLVARPLQQQQPSHRMIATQPPTVTPSSASTSRTVLTPSTQSTATTVIINGQLTSNTPLQTSGGRVKKFKCTWQGCDKAYTRPCDSTFQRDSHLKAHERTHLPNSAKTYECDECDKKFWTGQHLRKHVEVIHRGKTYDCTECDASFRKHHLLRAHIAETHCEPGTLPFRCEHESCHRSFKQLTHLKTHMKTHDLDRYMCAHPACLDMPLEVRRFGTWSALQKHTKEVHPPTCPHKECQSKTFTTSRGLRKHLQAVHSIEQDSTKKRRRRRSSGKHKNHLNETGGEEEEGEAEETAIDTDVLCGPDGDDDQDSTDEDEPALKKTKRQSIEAANDADVDGMPSLPELPRLPTETTSLESLTQVPATSVLSLLTGHGYVSHATSHEHQDAKLHHRKYICPFPVIVTRGPGKLNQSTEPSSRRSNSPVVQVVIPVSNRSSPGLVNIERTRQKDQSLSSSTSFDRERVQSVETNWTELAAKVSNQTSTSSCDYAFHRLYDVERHLKSWHKVEIDRQQLEIWFEKQNKT